jgi:predicted RNA-binding protein
MCLAKAYLGEGKGRQLVMEDVALLKIEGGKLHLSTLFGDQKEVEARVSEVDFQNARIILEALDGRRGK